MKKILIGSRAAFEHFPTSYYRNISNSDYDYLVDLSKPEFDILIKGKISIAGKRAEFHNVNSYKGLHQFFDNSEEVAAPEYLYTLKLSHCFWNKRWQKTMDDILFFQRNKVQLNDRLFSLLYNDWTEIHGDKRSYLNVSNEEFFRDAVDRVYPHDFIHECIAYYGDPLYNKCKRDKNKAILSHDLFLELSYLDQLRLCREEIYATALERFVVPANFRINSKVAYLGACRLLLTSMTKGWFPRFIAENWYSLYKPDVDFISIFKEKINYVSQRIEC